MTLLSPKPASSDVESSVRVIDRAACLLQAIAAHQDDGVTLTDLSKQTQLGRATVHRLLAALGNAGFVFQDLSNKRYRLGHALTKLGQTAHRQQVGALAKTVLDRLAAETGDTVYVSIPEGSAAICVGTAVGAFPIRTLTLMVGDARPLGVGGGSLALLAAMSDTHVARAITRNQAWLQTFPGYTPEVVQQFVDESRRQGYAYNRGRVVAGMSSVGVAVLNAQQQPLAALSIAAITERVSGERMQALVALLHREAAALALLLNPP